MKRVACRYAIVRFMPYIETAEFANVGIVLACPETGFFDFRMELRRHGRITAFFEELNPDIYKQSARNMLNELCRLRDLVNNSPEEMVVRAEVIRNIFGALTHPREAMIRFGEVRPLLASEPKESLDDLFNHYVRRTFVTPPYVEQSMARRIQALLTEIPLVAPFKREQIGDDQIHVNFPFVQRVNDQVAKIIKPLNLAQQDANQIYNHGDAWLQKVRRLRKRGLLPHDLLFPVAAPPRSDDKRFQAYDEICLELSDAEVRCIPEDDQSGLREFAMR